MKCLSECIKEKPWVGWGIFLVTLVAVFLFGLLTSSIMERRAEGLIAYTPATDIPQWETRNEKWGKNFPREYESWKATQTMDVKSKYNGSVMIDMLEVDPRLVVLWAGYGFAKDYNQSRGHYYAIEDMVNTLRTGGPTSDKDGPMPTTCWTCKSPDVPRVMSEIGVEEYYTGKWSSLGKQIVNPIGCGDCHDSKTMKLKITRPALTEAFQRMGKDIKKASHQEMRSLVCAQCHVEYFFKAKGKSKYLTFPWDNGTTVEAMEKYYDDANFKDWTHKLSKAPMLKTQHPGYEMFKIGIHAKRGLSCADCHMPYTSEGGVKYTNHHIVSPLKYMDKTCQVCHRESETELKRTIYDRQERIIKTRDEAEKMLVRAHVEAKKAWEIGATEAEMKPILTLIRHSQWRWDFAAASHGNSFHAPIETARIISTSIQRSQEARRLLVRVLIKHGFSGDVPYPDISTKAKAQKFIGLPMDKLNAKKAAFKKNLLPKWKKAHKERHESWDAKK